jgi:D-alanine-D-alanine ligase
MPLKVAIIYNDPFADSPGEIGESEAIIGVLEEVVAVKKALLELGHEVQQVALRKPLETVRQTIRDIKADLIFNLFEGFDDDPNTEPVVTAMMEEIGIPFTGNPSSVLALTLDKFKMKRVLQKANVASPPAQVLTPHDILTFTLNFPCIVKPKDEDASHGLTRASIVNNMEQLFEQVNYISSNFRGQAMVEEFVDGREFNASVLGNRELELVEISEITYSLPPELPRILTFESKWFEETDYYKGTGVTCPAPLSGKLREDVVNAVLASCRAAGCRGYARVDVRQDKDGSIKVLEVNANPDLTPELGIARQAATRGMTYADLIQKIVDLALE